MRRWEDLLLQPTLGLSRPVLCLGAVAAALRRVCWQEFQIPGGRKNEEQGCLNMRMRRTPCVMMMRDVCA